jgi:uncharacterized membrane protein YphA (DoxX/SURF4 family)
MNLFLWIIQSLLAVLFVFHGIFINNISPTLWENTVKKMGYSRPFLAGIGVLEVLGGLGLILPSWTRIMPILSAVAAVGLVIIMIGAVVTHVRHNEGKQVFGTGFITLLLAFVALGRWLLAPI